MNKNLICKHSHEQSAGKPFCSLQRTNKIEGSRCHFVICLTEAVDSSVQSLTVDCFLTSSYIQQQSPLKKLCKFFLAIDNIVWEESVL